MFDQMPDGYEFSGADIDAHWELFRKEMLENATLTEAEEEFYHVVNEAHRLSCIIKRLPTMGELRKYWEDQDAKKKP
jgi:hypothetical protein